MGAQSPPRARAGDSKQRFKILLLGGEAAGKSSLLARFLDNEFSEAYEPTIGMDFKSETLFLRGRVARFKIIDASGHRRFRSLLPQYVRDADAVLVAFDTTSEESFVAVRGWFDLIAEERGKLGRRAAAAQHTQLTALVGTKADLAQARRVSPEQAQALADQLGSEFFETSAKTGDGCRSLFQTVTQRLETTAAAAAADAAAREKARETQSRRSSNGDITHDIDLSDLDFDEYDDDFGANQSLWCKMCCCLSVLCPCLAFLCDPRKRRASVTGDSTSAGTELGVRDLRLESAGSRHSRAGSSSGMFAVGDAAGSGFDDSGGVGGSDEIDLEDLLGGGSATDGD